MTPQQIVALGVRFFSIFVALQSIEYILKIPNEIANTNLANHAYVSYAIGASYLSAALLLWIFPLFIANRIVSKSEYTNILNLQAFDAARVGSGLIGLWLLATGLPSVSWFIFRGATYAATNQSIIGSLEAEDKVRLGYYAAQLVLSFVLIFKSKYFAHVILGKDSK